MVKSKRLLATILTICMMVQLFACVTMASAMTQVWDGTVAEGYTRGIGTADDPYIISSAAELAYMSAQIGAGDDLNAYYKLGADITFNENLLGEDGLLSKTPSVSFTPIGTTSNMFGGSFDGDGHTISGLYTYTNGYGGLFLYARGTGADAHAVIKNLKIVDSYVCSYMNEGSGILAAKAYHITVTDVEVQGYVTQFNNAKPVGLFFSQLEGTVYMENCVARGIASGNDSRDGITFNNKSVGYAGGFAGLLSGRDDKQFVSCANYADVYGISAGGFFGAASTINYRDNYVSFTDCANYGNVTQFKYDNRKQNGNGAGGFIGSTADDVAGSVPRMYFTRCLNKGDVAGNLFAAGFIGRNGMTPWVDGATYSYTYTNCFNAGNLSLRITAEEYSGDPAHVTDGLVLRTGDYVAYMTNTSGFANNVIITDSYAIPCGAQAAFNNATPDKIAVTGEVAYATEADYKAGAWLGADASRWTVTANGPELTFASSSKPEHTHVYTSKVTTEATCQTEGVLTYTCECDDTYTEAIPVVDHSYGEDNKCVWCGKYNPAIAYAAEVDGVRYDTFEEAYAAAEAGDTIVLLADLEASEIITIDKAITLDGNYKTLTSTAGRAINVACNGEVAIENLTIVASGERAINVITAPATLTIDNVTATAANYTVNVAKSAGAANITVTNSDFTGLNVINVAGPGANVTVSNSKITCNDKNANEGYSALALNKDGVGATIAANNVEFYILDNSVVAKNGGAEGGVITIDGSEAGVQKAIAIITYPGSNYYYSFETLEAAIEKAKAGDTITLLADITANAIITIDKAITLDGNGKTLTSTAGRAINVECTGDVTIENLTIVAKGERAINIINQPANVTINNVTATAKNNAVMMATSAAGANLTVKDSDFTGLAVVNVASAGSKVEINNTKLTNVDANTNENYGAITVFATATNATINVNGGEIIVADDSRKAYIFAEGATVNGIDDVGKIVAMIGDAGFESLEKAVDYAKDGQTVKLVADAAGNGIVIDKDITLDMAGYTYTINGETVGSTGTKTLGFQLLKGSDITIVNGTIKSDKAKALIQNYANLTLDNVDLIGGEITQYVLSNNYGKTVLTNGTTITATEGNVAFDVAVGWSSAYSNATVIVADATIVGKIEVGNYGTDAKNIVLDIKGGDLTGATIVIPKKASGTVNKADTVVVGAPEGYEWEGGALVAIAYVAEANGVKYKTLEAAFAATTKGTITMLSDATGNGIVVPSGSNITLDLNGKVITGTPVESKAYAVINNNGNLTINDSVGGGAIICDSKLAGSTSYAVNTITNTGSLTINGGLIKNVSAATNQIGYAIDNNSTSKDAILVINGGEIAVEGSYYFDGIRLFCNSLTKENSVTVNGGKVSTIWLQNPSDGAEKNTKDVKGEVIVNGGNVGGIYLEPSASFDAAINGGYVGNIDYFQTADGRDLTEIIPGTSTATFGEDVSDFCADGFDAVVNADGTFGVVVHKHAHTAETIDPTCTEAGKTIYTCRCGDTYEKEIPATGHTYVDGVCKCGDVEAPVGPVYDEAFKPASANVVFESDYTLRFTVKTAVYEKYSNVYLVIEKEMFDGDTAIKSQVIELIEASKVTVNGEERYAYIVEGFAAPEIASEVTATLYGEDENGNVVYGKAVNYSLRQYAANQIKSANSSAEFKTMMVDFLNYGAAAQTYFGYNTTDLANNGLTEEQLALGTADRELVSAFALTDSSSTRAKFSSANLEFESKITIIAITNINGETYTANKDTWYAVAKYTNYLGEEITLTIPFSDARIGVDASGRTYINVNELAANEMSTPVEFTVYDGDGAAVTNTLTYSIETYAAGKVNGTNANLAALVKAMMKFGDSARVYRKG